MILFECYLCLSSFGIFKCVLSKQKRWRFCYVSLSLCFLNLHTRNDNETVYFQMRWSLETFWSKCNWFREMLTKSRSIWIENLPNLPKSNEDHNVFFFPVRIKLFKNLILEGMDIELLFLQFMTILTTGTSILFIFPGSLFCWLYSWHDSSSIFI